MRDSLLHLIEEPLAVFRIVFYIPLIDIDYDDPTGGVGFFNPGIVVLPEETVILLEIRILRSGSISNDRPRSKILCSAVSKEPLR